MAMFFSLDLYTFYVHTYDINNTQSKIQRFVTVSYIEELTLDFSSHQRLRCTTCHMTTCA